MKNLLLIYLFFGVLLNFCGFILEEHSIVGNGNIVAEEMEVSGFHGLKVSNGIDVFFTQRDTEE